jgi:shikimate kinase
VTERSDDSERRDGATEPNRLRPGAHLVLVGLPGAGKTTVGRLVAQKLGTQFVDLDEEIESRAHRSIASIFETEGEAAFRDFERQLTVEIGRRSNHVIAPGGGWITNPEVVALLRPPGRIIHLDVMPRTALSRMGADVISRPLLRKSDPLAALDRLRVERAAAYSIADAVIDTETLSLQELVDRVAELATAWRAGVG